MLRHWRFALALACGLFLGFALGDHSLLRPIQANQGSGVVSEIAALRMEIQAIKDRLPDQAHAMQDVANQFTNVWFAHDKHNWDLTNFYLGETRSHLRWAVRIIPKRKDKAGHEVDLASILQAFENSALKQMEDAIKSKSDERFVAAYRFSLESCYACHKAADKPYLHPKLPTGPAVQIINFDPSADWPR